MLFKNEKDFFYISEFELDALAKFYLDKPLSYVFYLFLKETEHLKKFSMNKCMILRNPVLKFCLKMIQFSV